MHAQKGGGPFDASYVRGYRSIGLRPFQPIIVERRPGHHVPIASIPRVCAPGFGQARAWPRRWSPQHASATLSVARQRRLLGAFGNGLTTSAAPTHPSGSSQGFKANLPEDTRGGFGIVCGECEVVEDPGTLRFLDAVFRATLRAPGCPPGGGTSCVAGYPNVELRADPVRDAQLRCGRTERLVGWGVRWLTRSEASAGTHGVPVVIKQPPGVDGRQGRWVSFFALMVDPARPVSGRPSTKRRH
jgi:hypothetical protein